MDSTYIKAVSAYNNAANMAAMSQNITNDPAEMPGFSDFSGLVSQAINKAQATVAKSEKISAKSLVGNANLANVVTAVSEAEVALQTIVNLRDKMVSAYQDIIKMPM